MDKKTNNGTIQGFNGVATVDKKHQVVIDAQAFGSGQEQHTLPLVLETIDERYNRLRISEKIYTEETIVTADTGFASEQNMKYLKEKGINAYVPDNQFRSRDPKFKDQKEKYGKQHQDDKLKSAKRFLPKDFDYNPENKTCICPAGHSIKLRSERKNELGHDKVIFEGYRKQCKVCELKQYCMKNPESADNVNGNGRQVSFIKEKAKRKPNNTDWMTNSSGMNLNSSAGPEGVSIKDDTNIQRVDSPEGKLIYSHRMSVVEPVFGNIENNKGLNRFSLRGKKKVQGQWQLYCIIHNIEKIKNYGKLAA